MKKQSKLSGAVLWASLLVFIAFVTYLLSANQEVLYTAHERSEFIVGKAFLHTLMQKPFGLVQYVGAWLTQFLYNPMLGAGMLAALWLLIFLVGRKAFGLKGGAAALMLLPVACLLTSVTDLGYWIYLTMARGYWFSQSVGYLAMLLLLWGARCTPRKWHLAWYVVGFCLYPVLGWFALLFVLCLAVMQKLTWRELIALLVLLTSAVVWHALLYSNYNLADLQLAGLPRFETPNEVSRSLSVPFYVLGIVTVLISCCGRYADRWLVPVLCMAMGVAFVHSLSFRDRNYIDEMRMLRHSQTDNWDEVLRIAADNDEPTTTMIMLRNIALMNKGGLLDRSFKMGNIETDICNPDTLRVGFLNTAAPLACYHYGLLTEAIRLNYECGIQTGFSPFYLKTLARCCQATGEEKLLDRLLQILHHHPFYKDWQPAPTTKHVQELQNAYSDEITGVESSSRFIVNSICLWDKADSKVASEQMLFYTLIRCDAKLFWKAFRKYIPLHVDDDFPLHAQEAYILYMDRAPEEKRMMLPVEEEIYNRYKAFCTKLESMAKPGVTLGMAAKDMRKDWGDTYWYYYFFKKQSY